MRATCLCRVVSASIASCLLFTAPTLATGPSLSGSVTANFYYVPDVPEIPGDQSYWVWNNATGSLSLVIPSVIDTTIKASAIGPATLNWSTAGNWTQPALDTSGVSVGQSGSGTFNYSINFGSPTLDVFRGLGPSEDRSTLSQVDITSASGAGEPAHYPDFATIQSNQATSKFNVTIPSGAKVQNDQFEVTVENFTVQSGGNMLDPLYIVRHNLTNHGSGSFGGTVQGNFINDAVAASGNIATVSNMVLEGQLQNTGELNVIGILQSDAATSNAGSIFLNSNGQLKANAAFTNNGSISMLSTGAYISGTGTFTNNGPFQWASGQIVGGAGFVNNSNSFSMSGSVSKTLIEPFTNAGTITQSGGGDFDIGGGNILTNQSGALYDITDDSGFYIAAGGGSISNAGTFRKSGGTGTSSIGIPLTNSGTLTPNSGTLTFNDVLTLNPSGKLTFQLRGSTASTDFGMLYKPGNLALAGAFQITLGPGFMPALGNSFDLLDWGGPGGGSLSGTFASLQLPPLASGLKWDTSQLYVDGTLSVAAGIPGDYNQNGVVDAADYVVWRDNLGTIYTPADYNTWRTHFGNTSAAGAALGASAVPEPPSLFLLTVALSFVFVRANSSRTNGRLTRFRGLAITRQ